MSNLKIRVDCRNKALAEEIRAELVRVIEEELQLPAFRAVMRKNVYRDRKGFYVAGAEFELLTVEPAEVEASRGQ